MVKKIEDKFIRFDRIHERDRQTPHHGRGQHRAAKTSPLPPTALTDSRSVDVSVNATSHEITIPVKLSTQFINLIENFTFPASVTQFSVSAAICQSHTEAV